MVVARNRREVRNTGFEIFNIGPVYLKLYFIRARHEIVGGRSVTTRDKLNWVVENQFMYILLGWYVFLNLIYQYVVLIECYMASLFIVEHYERCVDMIRPIHV